MSRSLGPALPPPLLALLSQTDLDSRLGRALPFVTRDADDTPHPMLCSFLEWLAVEYEKAGRILRHEEPPD